MKQVLITGADGFIGSNILDYLLEHTDWKFTCLCSWRHNGNPLNVPHDDRVTVITCDLRGPIPDEGVAFDYILHLASESHVDRSIKDPVPFVENNVSSTLQVLEFARRIVPEKLIMFSTDEVYGANDHLEWDVLLPSNPYAASKAAQEMLAIAYWKTYQVPVIITNSNNIVGKRQHHEKFLPKIIHAVKHDEELEIHVHNKQPGRRVYNPVQNVADALLYILENTKIPVFGLDSDRPARYSLPGGVELDNLELATMVAKLIGKRLKFVMVEATTIRPGYDEFYPHTDGALSGTGWTPPYDFEEQLKEMVDFYD